MLLRRLCQHQARRLYSTQQSLFPTRTIRSLLDTTQDKSNVAVRAWIRSVRKQKQVAFANINDGSSLKGMQAILTPEQAERLDIKYILLAHVLICIIMVRLSTGACVELQGTMVDSPGKEQGKELQVTDVRVLGGCDSVSNI